MTPANFKRLMDGVGRHWYRTDGLVVLLTLPGSEKYADVRLVVPPSSMLPETCLLWLGERKLYEGPLGTVELREALTSARACRARYVRPSRLANPIGSPSECLGCSASCRSGERARCRRRWRVRNA